MLDWCNHVPPFPLKALQYACYFLLQVKENIAHHMAEVHGSVSEVCYCCFLSADGGTPIAATDAVVAAGVDGFRGDLVTYEYLMEDARQIAQNKQ